MNAAYTKHATLTEHHSVAEAACALRLHLVAANQEASDTVIDVVVNCLIGSLTRTVVKV